MNKFFAIALLSSSIIGCASTQPTQNAAIKDLVLCKTNEICPAVKVARSTTNSANARITIDLDDTYQEFNIQQVVFDNGQKQVNYPVTGATKFDYIAKMHRSTNSIEVPISLLKDLGGTDTVSMTLVTDRGNITRYILNNGEKSGIYNQFSKLKSN